MTFEVDSNLSYLNSIVFEVAGGVGVFSRLQECFGRNAANVQADTTELLLSTQATLRPALEAAVRPHSRQVRSDHNEVVCVCH